MPKKVDESLSNQVIKLYLEGNNYSNIKKTTGLHESTIYRILNRSEIKRRMPKKYYVDESFFEIDSQEKYWFLGLMGADGTVINDLHFSISQSGDVGLKLINYIKNKIEYEGVVYKYKNANSLSISNRNIVKILKKHGIIKGKTLNFKPRNIKNKYFKSFLRGYFEGDGSVGIYEVGGSKNFLIASFVGTREFIEYVKPFLPSNFKERNIKRCKNLVEIRYSGKFAYYFLKWLYSNKKLYFSYKYDIFKKWLSYDHKFLKVNKLKNKAKKLYESGMNCMEIAKKLKVNFQEVYKWRNSEFKHL